MVLAVVRWTVIANMELDFETAFTEAQKILESMHGYNSHRFEKCLENPNKYILLVEWETLEDHTIGFQQSEKYQEYREIIRHYFEPGTTMEHYNVVSERGL